MTIVPKKKKAKRFSKSRIYRHKEPHAMHYISQRTTFWIAVFTLFSFVTGNMMGQHGWHVFWSSVLGNGIESTIAYDGFASPLSEVPDFKKWATYGGDIRQHTYRQIPKDILKPFPAYDHSLLGTPEYDRVYLVDNLGTYETGRGEGSHPGMDLVAAVGTPVHSVANGIVYKVANDPGGYGNYIVIKHPNVPDPDDSSKLTSLYSIYGHLEASTVEEGDVVMKGDIIATTGLTGFTTGPHLHFQIDRDEAPWHPYWPFTGAEARSAGESMTQAVDAGLHRERGLLYTVHPMLYIQSHTQGTGLPKVAATSSKSASSSIAKLTIEDRRKMRMAKRNITDTMLVAVRTPEDRPIVAASASSSSSSATMSATPVEPMQPTNFTTAIIKHDGSFSVERTREKVTITLVDDLGDPVANPLIPRSLEMRTAYGKAEFYPSSLKASDFKDGKATIEMLPLGQQTVVILLQPLGAMSSPMVFSR